MGGGVSSTSHAATLGAAGAVLDLRDQQRELQDLSREFARAEVEPVAAELDRDRRFAYELVARLGDLGLMGVPYPIQYGGAGADALSYALVIEQLGWADQSLALSVAAHTSLGTYPIYAFGDDQQKQRWLPELCSGRSLAAFGLTEPHAGSDAANTRTKARLEDGQWVIDGTKQFIGNSGTDISACVTITARTADDEISNLIVERDSPGYEVGPGYRKIGWNAADVHPLSFSSCRVPEGNLLGRRGEGFRQFLATLDGGRISIAALALGCIQRCLDEALDYAKQRRAFGRPISKFQAIQVKLADLTAELEAARLLTYKAALLRDAGRPFNLTAAQAKLKTGRLAVRAADEAVQIHGGNGYIEDYAVARFYRDAKVLTIGEGTDEVQEMIIARHLGL